MKKRLITAAIWVLGWLPLSLLGQETSEPKKGKLSFDEFNFVSSYYQQKGDHAAVTGGNGSEALTDLAGSFDVSFSMFDKKNRKNTFKLDASLERYTSASSDQIDPSTISSASSSDIHYSPSFSWQRQDEEAGKTFRMNLSYSGEYDYHSIGYGAMIRKLSADKNGEFSAGFNFFNDRIMVILPSELRPILYPTGSKGDKEGISYRPRNSLNLSFSYSKVVNTNLQLLFSLEPSYQEGLLSTPFHRVYFNDGTLKVERLPGERIKLPASVRANYFAGDNVVLRSFYRFYVDDWGLKAHTVSLETVFKLTPFLSLTPHYRLNSQSGIDYFASFEEQSPLATYYTSDYDLSRFLSQFGGIGFRMVPPGGVLGMAGWHSLDLRYGYYQRNNGLSSHIVSLAIGIK